MPVVWYSAIPKVSCDTKLEEAQTFSSCNHDRMPGIKKICIEK